MKFGFLRGFVFLVFGSLITGAILTACKADIILPPARGLEGDYAGLLIITTPDTTQTDHVILTLRLNDPNIPDAGTYSHRFDSLTSDTTDAPDFCDMPRGDWSIKNSKLIFSPGPAGVSETCNAKLIPTSLVEETGGSINEFPFGFRTTNNDPPEEDLGDSLTITQTRLADGITTVFELTLIAIPQQ